MNVNNHHALVIVQGNIYWLLRFMILMLAAFFLVACMDVSQEYASLPPLLRNVSSGVGGGWGSGCPPTSDENIKQMASGDIKYSISPELQHRLDKQFPPGTDTDRVITELNKQSFKLEDTCDDDPMIQIALFSRTMKTFLPYILTARVYWKIDEQHRLVWVKGFVSFISL